MFSSRIDKGTGIIYGDAMKLFPKDRVVWSESRELSTIKCDPPFMHQCVFTKRHLAVHNLFVITSYSIHYTKLYDTMFSDRVPRKDLKRKQIRDGLPYMETALQR